MDCLLFRKVPRDVIDSWLVAHSVSQSGGPGPGPLGGTGIFQTGNVLSLVEATGAIAASTVISSGENCVQVSPNEEVILMRYTISS